MTIPEPDSTWRFETMHLGRRVCVYRQLDSTNSLALSLAENPAHDGLVLLAQSQTSGRGQYGRVWQAPPRSSVLLSVLLFPPPDLRRPALMTAWAAVSVCETIFESVEIPASIKWPNDVLVDGKKICGILIEQRTTGDAAFPLATVAGIGLNVAQTAAMFAEAGLPLAGSLASVGGKALRSDDVARTLIRRLDKNYCLLQNNGVGAVESAWQDRLGLLGKDVIAEEVNQAHVGRLVELAFSGLAVETTEGRRVRLMPESVRQLRSIT